MHRLTLNRTAVDIFRNGPRISPIHLAAYTERRAEDLLDGTSEVLGEGLEPHCSGNVDDVFKGDALGVLNVLLLLSVARGLL